MKKINFNIQYNLKTAIFTLSALFFLYLLYLSVPSLYDTGRVQKVLYNKILKEFQLNLSLSSNISYRILPLPHFHIQDSKIFQTKSDVSSEIGQVKNLKVFISQNSLFNEQKIKIKKLVFSEANFFFTESNLDFVNKVLIEKFSKKKIFIKKSKAFFNDNSGDTIFIYSLKNLEYFMNFKDNSKILSTNGSIFKVPIKFHWIKKIDSNNTISNFSAKNLDIDFSNKGEFYKDKSIYVSNLNILSNNLKTDYIFDKNKKIISVKSEKSLIKNTPISYKGIIELSPFNFNLNVIAKDLDLNQLFKDQILFNEIISSGIFSNKNLNGTVKIKSDKLYNNKIFDNGNININLQEGNINFDQSTLSKKNKFQLILVKSTFLNEDNNLILEGKLELNIIDMDEFYKIFPVPKKIKFKKKFKKINFEFSYSLVDATISINKISFLNKKNEIEKSKTLDDFVEDNYENRYTYSNPIFFKNFMKKALVTYLDEG